MVSAGGCRVPDGLGTGTVCVMSCRSDWVASRQRRANSRLVLHVSSLGQGRRRKLAPWESSSLGRNIS